MAIQESDLLEIANKHLSTVKKYDPYANFEGIEDRDDFIDFIGQDPAFSNVGFDNDKYAIARVGGNLVTSMHRKLGDMYEEIFQYILVNQFSVLHSDLHFSVEVPIGTRTQIRSTDGLLRNLNYIHKNVPVLSNWVNNQGVAFEVRSCYQIGDSKRIQADWDMALALSSQNIVPVMLIMCSSSLKSPVRRLRNSWVIYEGNEAFKFIKELSGFDLLDFMSRNRATISRPINEILANL